MASLKTAAGVAVALAVLSGCKPEDYRLAFSHNLHVKENAIACADCHGASTDGRFRQPGHEQCTSCHGEWIEAKTVSADTCGKCHKEQDGQPPARPAVTNPPPETAVFRHGEALSNRCEACHGTLLDPKQKSVPEMGRRARVEMRNKAHRWQLSCQTCHADLDAETPPPNHAQNWTRRHGVLAEQADNACGVCHREQGCRDCHEVARPESHNELWRLKTHGVAAAFDRNRCQVCHQQDACTSCHESIRPQSHNAAWARNHCNQCHAGEGGGAQGSNCRTCHDVSSHPYTHTPSYRQQHCFSCHEGSPQAQQCAACHGGSAGGSLQQIHSENWPPVHDRFLGHNVDCFYCHESRTVPRAKPARRGR